MVQNPSGTYTIEQILNGVYSHATPSNYSGKYAEEQILNGVYDATNSVLVLDASNEGSSTLVMDVS